MPARKNEAVEQQALELWAATLIEEGQAIDQEEAAVWIDDLRSHNEDYYEKRFSNYRRKIRAIPPRETTEDAICFPSDASVRSLSDVPQGATIGTGSVRRAAQLLHLRPDLQIEDIRGNVDTRLEKLDSGQYDAIILAAAGLTRLELADRIGFRFDQQKLLAAVGQGALGLEVRSDNEQVHSAIAELNHSDSFHAALAERAMLKRLFAGCLAPVGARCHVDDGQLSLTGVVLSRDGKQRVEATESSSPESFAELGISVAETLIEKGADRLLSEAKA